MSREFKFRFWKPEEKRWVNFPSRSGIKSFESLVDPIYTDSSYFIIQQYTGLKDKDGVEIYEGDIIEGFNLMSGGFVAEVFWNEYEPSFQIRTSNGAGAFLNEEYVSNFKIIGNIFENPDLIE